MVTADQKALFIAGIFIVPLFVYVLGSILNYVIEALVRWYAA